MKTVNTKNWRAHTEPSPPSALEATIAIIWALITALMVLM